LHLQSGIYCGGGRADGIKEWGDLFYLLPRHDMAASFGGSVWLYAVKGVWAEVDGVSVANIGLPGFTNLPDEGQCSLGVGDGESCSPACLDLIVDNAEHHRDVVQTAVILSGPPFAD